MKFVLIWLVLVVFLKTENPDNQLIIRVLKTFSRGGRIRTPIYYQSLLKLLYFEFY
jgi:hypothetical protein